MNEPRKTLEFRELVNPQDWQKIQDIFFAVTNISLRTVDPDGKLITHISGQPRFCKDLLKNTIYGLEECENCLPTFLGGRAVVDRNFSFVCPPGFHNFFAPIKVDNKVKAYILLGPVVLVMRKPKEYYFKLAEELLVNLDELWQAVLEIRVISFHRAKTLMDLLVKISEFILSLSATMAGKGGAFVISFSEQFNGILDVLLDLGLQISGADTGSIMLLDKNKQNLTIRASRGLPEDVVKNTRQKIGKGICGTVVMENQPLLIDERLPNNRIKEFLNKPNLKSAMILPIGSENMAVGTVNLSALKISPVNFDNEGMETINKVIGLAIEALYMPFKSDIKSKAAYLEQLL